MEKRNVSCVADVFYGGGAASFLAARCLTGGGGQKLHLILDMRGRERHVTVSIVKPPYLQSSRHLEALWFFRLPAGPDNLTLVVHDHLRGDQTQRHSSSFMGGC